MKTTEKRLKITDQDMIDIQEIKDIFPKFFKHEYEMHNHATSDDILCNLDALTDALGYICDFINDLKTHSHVINDALKCLTMKWKDTGCLCGNNSDRIFCFTNHFTRMSGLSNEINILFNYFTEKEDRLKSLEETSFEDFLSSNASETKC